MKVAIGIILIIIYFVNWKVVGAIFPLEESDYYDFVGATKLRWKIYEVMFCLFFYSNMIGRKGFTRSVFTFGFVVSAASCVDKIILNISHYLVTDVLVVIVALGAAFYAYKKTQNVQSVE